jgi:ankyrin repeat protein
MRQDHQLLALKMLFNEEQVTLLQSNTQCILSDEEITMIGIVQVSDDGKLHFIHRTFAEYYAADYFVNQLTKQSNNSQQVQDLLLQKILPEGKYRVIRVFIDGLLSRCNPQKEALKQYGNRISEFWGYGELTLHQLASESNVYIIGFLLESLQAGEHTNIAHDLLLAKGVDKYSAWHVAAKGRQPHVLQKLWEWGKKILTAEELRNKLLLAKDNKETTAWHYAAMKGKVELLQNLWEWGKETLTAEELGNKLLLAKDNKETTAWHYATMKGKVELLQKLWECGKETLTAEELSNKLLLAKDKWGQTAWNLAAREGKIEILQKLWDWGKETLTAEELNNNLLLAKDNIGQTAWYSASSWGHVQVLHVLWECGKETLTQRS